MNANQTTTEKILAEALELHEKGVSLHSIVRTYPEHRTDIEELFSAMATLSLEKEKVRIPAGAFERMLEALPATERPLPKRVPIKSPFTDIFASLKVSSLRYVLPLAALALITGGVAFKKDTPETQVAIVPASDSFASKLAAEDKAATSVATSLPTAAPTAMMAMKAVASNPTDQMVASFQEEAAYEATIAGRNDADTEQALGAENITPTPYAN